MCARVRKHPKTGRFNAAGIVEAWPELPEHIRQAIMALVEGSVAR
jgi:hypothetical protein